MTMSRWICDTVYILHPLKGGRESDDRRNRKDVNPRPCIRMNVLSNVEKCRVKLVIGWEKLEAVNSSCLIDLVDSWRLQCSGRFWKYSWHISPAETCLGRSIALWCSDAGFLLRAGNRLFLPAVQVNVTGCFTEIFTEIIPRMFVWSKVKSHCVYGKILLSSSNQCCEDI